MTDTSNIIPFPKTSGNVPEPSEVFSRLTEAKGDEIETIIDMICSDILDTFNNAGFPVVDDIAALPDVCFVLESVRSLVEKYYDIEHPFHKIAENCFQFEGDKLIFTNPKFKLDTEERTE